MGVYFNPSQLVSDGLVFLLDAANPFSYPGTGSTWYDLSNSKSHGLLINGPIFSSNNGGRMFFDTSKDLEADHNLNITTGQVTLSMWVSFPDVNWHTFSLIFTIGDGIDSFGIGRWYDTLTTPRFTVKHSKWIFGSNQTPDFNNIITVNTYYNIVASANAQTSTIVYYLNGNKFTLGSTGNASMTGISKINLSGINNPFIVNGFHISQALIYNRILSDEEVYKNYIQTQGRYIK